MPTQVELSCQRRLASREFDCFFVMDASLRWHDNSRSKKLTLPHKFLNYFRGQIVKYVHIKWDVNLLKLYPRRHIYFHSE